MAIELVERKQDIVRMRVSDIHIPPGKDIRLYNKRFVDDLAQSIRMHGFTHPIVINEDGDVVKGIGWFLASQKLGLRMVPCVRKTQE